MDNRVYCPLRQNLKAKQESCSVIPVGDALRGHRKDTSLALCSSAPVLSHMYGSIYIYAWHISYLDRHGRALFANWSAHSVATLWGQVEPNIVVFLEH